MIDAFRVALAVCAAGLALYLLARWAWAGFALAPLRRVLTGTPAAAAEPEARLARMLAPILRESIAVTVVLTPLISWLAPEPEAGYLLVLGGWLALGCAGLYTLLWSGRIVWAGRLFPVVIFGVVTLGLFTGTGVLNIVVGAYVIVIISAGLLLGGRAAVWAGVICVLMLVALLLFQIGGLFGPLEPAAFGAHTLVRIGIFALAASLLRQAAHRIDESLAEARRLRAVEAEQNRRLGRSLEDERKRARQTELLNDFARTLTGLDDPQCLTDEAVRRLGADFGFEAAAIYLVGENGLEPQSRAGLYVDQAEAGRSVADWVVEHGETCWITDTQADRRYTQVPGAELACLVAVPMRLARIVVGVLIAGSIRPKAFHAAEVRTIESLADLLVAALQTGQLFAQLRQRQQMTEALRRIGVAVSATLDLPRVLAAICAETRQAFQADRVEVWLEQAEPARLERVADLGRPLGPESTAALFSNGSEPPGALLAQTLSAGRQRFSSSVLTPANLPPGLSHFGEAQSSLLVPLRKDDRPFGALVIGECSRAARFTAEDAAAADVLGGQVAAALDNARHYAAHRRRADDLALINDITHVALEISELDLLLQALADRLGALIGADGCYLTLWDEARRTARPATASAALRDLYLQVRPAPPPGQPSLTETVLSSGAALPVPDIRASPFFEPGLAARLTTRSLLGVPLMAGEQRLGAALIAFDNPHTFTAEEIATAEQAGRQIALALARAQALAAARRRQAELESLRQASLQLTSSLEPRAVLEAILHQTLTLAGASDAHLFLYENERLTFGAALWANGDQQQAFKTARRGGLTETVARTGQRVVVPDVNANPLFANWRWGGAIVGLPLRIGSAVRGVMNVAYDHPHDFPESELRVLELLADQAAIALENARLFEAESRRAAQLALLSEVSQQVADTLDEPVLLQRAVDAMVNRLGYVEAAVLLPVASDELEVAALAKTIEMAVAIGFRQKIGAGVAGRAAETRATYLANDVSRDPHYFDPEGRAHGSALALPLLREGRLLGVLYLETDQPEAFSPADVVAYETLAQHVTTALQNARLYAAARDRLRDVLALQSVSEAVVASLELDRIIANVVALLRDTIGYRYVSLYILDGDLLRLKAQVGYPDELIIPTIPTSRGVSGRAVRTRQTQFVPDVTADPDFLQAHYEVRSEICVPLLKDDMVLGTLNIESDPNHRLTPDDVSLLNALAGQVTVALINARLFEAEREQRALNEALREASVNVSASLDFETVLDRLLTQLERVVPCDVACVMLFDAGQAWVARQRGYDHFGPAAVAAIGAATWDVAATPNLARLVGTGQPVLIADTAADPHWHFLPDLPDLRAWIGTPAIAQGEVLACFVLGKDQPNFYTDIHAARLEIFASQSALALQNARLFAAQQRRSEEQRLLLSAARDLAVGLSQDAVLMATARHLTTALHSAACAVSIWERELDRVVTLFDYSSHTDGDVDVVGSIYYLRDYPTTRRVLEDRLAVITRVNDPAADPAEADLLRRFGHAAGLMVPLFTGDHVLGLIEVQRDAGDPPFTDADLQLAQSLAAQAAVALENARLHAAVHENLRERDALLEASAALLSTLDLGLLLQNILAAALTAIPRAEKGTIILADDTQSRLRVAAAYGYADPRVARLEFGPDQGYTAQALRGNRPLLINDVAAGPMILPLGEIPEMDHIRSAIVAPLTPKGVAGAPLGAISLDSTAAVAFTSGDLRVLETFANTAAIAIDNARLHAEVSRLAVTDSLTNLANPRAFEQALAVECHRAGRYGYALSLVIMDIDNFKHYNDTYGHPAGNERLKAIADILRANVRDPDLPVRYGGEEFALLLPHTNKAGALALAERIREAAELGAPPDLPRGVPLPGYSLSLGVASFPIDALTADQLLVAADNAELAAKRNGKNRVVAAPPLAPEFGAA